MAKREDIAKILIIGSGPIVIGQGCEFDYSGTQACKVLMEEGYDVILINSNPATIMTDPDLAGKTYIEPITPDIVERIIECEKPDALLPTMGGQTGLNTAKTLYESGFLTRNGVKLIGANYDAIIKAEDRDMFKRAVEACNLRVPKGMIARDEQEAMAIINEIPYPLIIRPSFTLGGAGGAIAYNIDEYKKFAVNALEESPVNEILVEESIIGWKEFELEVMRDHKDNVVIICSIENLDPMGVHTGDSITVAPAQTLSDREYQMMRDAAIAIIREIGVDTGGSNIQFAVNPANGEMVVIEMNPRVSRSSALASKATGFPIAKIAAKLAVGYSLDEIKNDITKETPASFEPSIDYCVVKIPRFNFDKFPSTNNTLTTQMKSVGEAMAIGRTFKEALLKAIRSLELDFYGLEPMCKDRDKLINLISVPTPNRIFHIADALRAGMSTDEIFQFSGVDPWFTEQMKEIVETEILLGKTEYSGEKPDDSFMEILKQAKKMGFSDITIAGLINTTPEIIRQIRKDIALMPTYKMIDTCAAEFEAKTPYLYSTYSDECEAAPTNRKKVIILGGGPNRIGQGIEFDYCCCHAVFALQEEGYEAIMVNCNPETVSTDYDTSDRLYFEPLTEEDVIHIIEKERPYGLVVQFGGQTPLKLAMALERHGVRILGTSPEAIDMAENRERFSALIEEKRHDGLKQPASGIAYSYEEAAVVVKKIGYPVMVRPSYVLGGRAMEIVYDLENLKIYMDNAAMVSSKHPILIDKYLEDAVEVDVDAVSDGSDTYIAGIMEHIEEAGVHSGDSACSLPPFSLDEKVISIITSQTKLLARELKVIGLLNIQFAVKNNEVYILEVNPRASRTVPFVSKVMGVPYAKLAMKVMLGRKLQEIAKETRKKIEHIAVKEAVFPFKKFSNVDTILGPEMKSTGEVMGMDYSFGWAFAKAQAGAGMPLPETGRVFLSVKDKDKSRIVKIARDLLELGFSLEATSGTAAILKNNGLEVERINKLKEGRPHVGDNLKNKTIALVINTPGDKQSDQDSFYIRRTALKKDIPYYTTISGARAAVEGLKAIKNTSLKIKTIQEYHAD